MKYLNDLAEEVHAITVEKGFWDMDRSYGEVLMLIVTEVTEAMEAVRNGNNALSFYNGKPEGFPSELADIILRVLDACAAWNIDIDFAVRSKIEYNKTREHLHGRLR